MLFPARIGLLLVRQAQQVVHADAVKRRQAAQQKCEDIYVATGGEEPELFVMDKEHE